MKQPIHLRAPAMTGAHEEPDEAAPLEQEPPSSRLHWVLVSFFLGLLGLLLVSGAIAIRFLKQMHAQELVVRHVLADRAQMLSGLWLSIQNYNEAVQQYISQAPAQPDQAVRNHLDQLSLEIYADLNNYPQDRNSEEAAFLQAMLNVFTEQRRLYVSIITLEPPARLRQAPNLMTEQLMPLHQRISEWSQKLRAWNGEQLLQADQALAAQFGRLQAGLTRALTISLGSGLLLVLASMLYIARLERQRGSRYLELAQSRHELRRLSARLLDAQETERRSISRELHDEIGQSLGALLVDLGRLSATLASDRPEVKAQLENMKSVAERTVDAVRNIALLLRPSMLDDLGLVAALEWQGREVSRRSAVEVEVQSENVPDNLPDEHKICIYRLVQEALNNAVRHSGAKNVKVTVERSGNKIVVRVSDDGRGFDPKRVRGLGILGMEERVKRLGGTLTVDSQPGQGTTLVAELPLDDSS
jgi:signal transduction histidine kinase